MRSALLLWSLLGSTFLGLVPATAAQEKAAPTHPESANDQMELRAVVDQLYTSYAEKNLARWIALWDSKSPDLKKQQKAAAQFFAGNKSIEIRNLSVQQIKVEGSKVHLRVAFELSAVDTKTGKTASDSGPAVHNLDLVRESGGWKTWREEDAYSDLALQLINTENVAERSRLLDQEKDLVTRALIQSLNKHASSFRSRREFAKAQAGFEVMRVVGQRIGERKTVCIALRSIGDVVNMQGDHRKALEYYGNSLQLAKEVDDQLLIARALINMGVAHGQMSEFDEALKYFQDAEPTIR